MNLWKSDRESCISLVAVIVFFIVLFILLFTLTNRESQIVKPSGMEELQQMEKEFADTKKNISQANEKMQQKPVETEAANIEELPELKKPEGMEEQANAIKENAKGVENASINQQNALEGIDSDWVLPDEKELQVDIQKPEVGDMPEMEMPDIIAPTLPDVG